jgi:hypothetical protein
MPRSTGKQFEILNPPEVVVEVPPAVDNSQALNAAEEKTAIELAAYVEKIKATEDATYAKSAKEFPAYIAEK